MKKGYIFFLIILIISILAISIYLYNYVKNNNSNNNANYDSSKLSTSDSSNLINNDININDNENSTKDKSYNENANNQAPQDDTSSENKATTENLISEYTTKIYTKDSDRQNNVSITCSTLDNTIVQNGETFSFCNTVGKATSNKGYKKADVYKDGEVVQALGGGNCQVSSTLYNAVLKLNNIKVTERHSHSNSVPYVSKGKDAAVAYGSYDLKFVNNTGKALKINSSCDKNNVYIKLFEIIS